MADTLKQYCNILMGTASATATLLASMGASGGIIRNIHLCNTASSAQTVNISFGTATYEATRAIYSSFSIPAGGVHVANVNIVGGSTGASSKIYGYASGTNIIATISGVDL